MSKIGNNILYYYIIYLYISIIIIYIININKCITLYKKTLSKLYNVKKKAKM